MSPPSATLDHALTARRRDVLELLADGRTPKQIARDLAISLSTCRGHIQDVLDAFEAQTALQAVLAAQQEGVVACRCGATDPVGAVHELVHITPP